MKLRECGREWRQKDKIMRGLIGHLKNWGVILSMKEKPWKGGDLIIVAFVRMSLSCFFCLPMSHFQICFMILSNWSPVHVTRHICFWLSVSQLLCRASNNLLPEVHMPRRYSAYFVFTKWLLPLYYHYSYSTF